MTPEIYIDSLTRLPNRALFEDRVEQSVAQARRSNEQIAIHYFELDNLKGLLETHGKRISEGLIKGVADRIRSFIRKSDTFSRLEGGEFAIIQRGVGNSMGVTTLVQKVLHALEDPFVVDGREIRTSVSVGISLLSPDVEPREIMAQAEHALHMAKEKSHQDFRFHDAAVDEAVQAMVVLRKQLESAIENEEFFLEYQPQVDLSQNRIIAAEALIRWRHPERGVLGPDVFIPVAEDGGLIVPLGQWVLEEACRQRQAWNEAGLKDIPIAVNVSGVQFQDPGFPDRVIRILETTQLEPDALDLEFTESVLLRSSEELKDSLAQLADRGVKFSLDDFGTGYSSLRSLRAFPVQKLKIAGEFVRDMISNPDAASIVEAVIGLGHMLDLKVVAEEVETEQQLEFLRNHHCDAAQGYLLGRPEAAGDFAKRLT